MTAPVPATGERVASRDQVMTRAGFGGNAPAMVSSRDPRGTARRLLARMRPERGPLVAVLVFVTVSSALTVAGPRILGHATDVLVRGLTSGAGVDFVDLRNVLLAALGVYVAGAGLSWIVGYIFAGVVQRVMKQLRSDVEDKIHRLPLAYVDGTPRGDLLSRVTNDIDNLAQSLQMSTTQALNQVLLLVGVVVMMISISPLLALFSTVLIPLSMFVVRLVAKNSRRRFAEQWRHTGELNSLVEETFTGHSLVKVFGQQRDVERDFSTTNDQLYRAGSRAQFVAGVMQPIMMFVGNLNYIVVAVLGSVRVTTGAMSVGDIQAFIQYARQYTQPLTALAGILNMIQSSLASSERVFELLDAPEERAEPGPVAATDAVGGGRVEFSHVSFRYAPDRPLIDDLSFVAEPGETVAIVGPTGAGKTTLVNLIMRFYELDGGSISLDGVDIATLDRARLRSQIGMVLQDTWLFEGTILDNIRYGNLEASESQILDAAKAAYVDRFVHALPDGYDTVIDEDGGNLSAGEKQLLTIARAFLNDPSILILDEATSSVDTRTEVLVQHAMAALRSRRTSFVIAHRLSTIRDADHILMMENGSIVEQGGHDELLARRGAFFALYDAQFRSPIADEAEGETART